MFPRLARDTQIGTVPHLAGPNYARPAAVCQLPVMSADRWADVDRYLDALLIEPDEALDAARDTDLPAIEVSPLQGKLLHLLARLVQPRAILELGTLGGYSTIWLARALVRGGRLVTLEVSPEHAAVARENLARAGFDTAGISVEVVVGPALETLPDVRGPFDVVFLDADKRSNSVYLDWAIRLGRPGTLIVADNVVRGGALLEDFFERVAAEPRVDATAIQTVGIKGWDGFALAVVR
jgi:predicted O-methyltransferase YrrM